MTPRKSKYNDTRSRTKSYPLTTGQRKKLVQRQLVEFNDVLKVHCHLDGCQHARIQGYLALGYLPTKSNTNIHSCGGTCAVCSGSWHRTFLPVDKQAVLLWFNSGSVRDTFPMDASVENLFQLLWKIKHWTKAIFDRGFSMVLKSHIEAFFCN